MDENIRPITDEELAVLRTERPDLFEPEHPETQDYWHSINELLFDSPGG